jgi:hypothetical protein
MPVTEIDLAAELGKSLWRELRMVAAAAATPPSALNAQPGLKPGHDGQFGGFILGVAILHGLGRRRSM